MTPMIVQRAAIRVRKGDRLGGQFDGVQGGLVAAVRNVDEHAHLVHCLDDLLTVVADPAVDSFRGTAAEQILRIVSQLRTAQS